MIEIRAPKAGKQRTISGYYDNYEAAAREAAELSGKVPAVYFTLHSIKPDLLARRCNRMESYVETTTADNEVSNFEWLPIDLDAKRPTGISSTDEEHAKALTKASEIQAWLVARGWPANAFMRADSGNGGHLTAKIDLEATDENEALIKRCLQALDSLFSDESVTIDTSVYNPARIWKLPGTAVCKGDNMPERPHRVAKLLERPDALETVTREMLVNLAALIPQVEGTVSAGSFDPVKYAEEHGAKVVKVKPWIDPGGKKWTFAVLAECPFNSDHNRGEARIGAREDGARHFGCYHNSCQGNDWKALRKKWEGLGGDNARVTAVQPNGITSDDITKTGERGKAKLSPTKASREVLNKLPLAMCQESDKVYRYDGQIYRPDGERIIDTALCSVAEDLVTNNSLKEVLRRVKSELLNRPVRFDPNPYLFPAVDGVIDLKTGETREAKPEDYITFKYGSALNCPNADYRPFLWFLCSSLPDPRDVVTVIDIITAIALRIPFDIIVLLFGGGSNGKGILEKVMLALFTMGRATAIQLEEMKKSRFGLGAMLGKDVWIVTEVESVKDAMSALKKISTGELIDSDVKYGQRVQGMPHLVPILDANIAFDFGDDSRGRKRRVAKLDFPYTFGDDPDMRPIDRHLDEKLTRPEILAGITRIITARAPKLIEKRKISVRKTSEEADDEYKRQRFSSYYFCEDCLSTTWPHEWCPLDGDDSKKPVLLTVETAYNEYKKYCKLFNVTTPKEKSPFGKYISERYGIQSTVSSEKKESYRFYPGLYLINTAQQAYANNKVNYCNYSITTEELQENTEEIDNSSNVTTATTATTGDLLLEVSDEIERMFKFIQACTDVKSITYENYLKNPVVPVVPVVGGHSDAVLQTTVDNPPDAAVVHEDIGKREVKHMFVEFLESVGKFTAEDLFHPGHMISYGPYECGNQAALPERDAQVLISNKQAVQMPILSSITDLREAVRDLLDVLEEQGRLIVPLYVANICRVDLKLMEQVFSEEGFVLVPEIDERAKDEWGEAVWERAEATA